MNLNKLPFELVEHTFNYLYGICDHCFDVVFAEDLQKNVEFDVQEMTDKHILKIDAIFQVKEKEIMTV